MYLLAICRSFLEKCLFRSSSHFYLFIFALLSCMSSLFILDINPLLDKWLTNIFSQSIGCFFILLTISFSEQMLFSLMQSCLFIFAFVACALVFYAGNHCQGQCQGAFFYVFFQEFYSFRFFLKSLIHFEFIFVSGVRQGFNFIFLHVVIQFSQHRLLKRLSFPHRVFLAPLSNTSYHICEGLFLGS